MKKQLVHKTKIYFGVVLFILGAVIITASALYISQNRKNPDKRGEVIAQSVFLALGAGAIIAAVVLFVKRT